MIFVTGATVRSSRLIVERIVKSDAECRDGVIGNGVPAHQADLLLSIYAVGRCGEFGATDQALGRLLGRPTMSASDALSRHIAG